jgi:hypothetical protein
MCWQCAPLLVFSVDNIDLSILATLIIGEPSAHARTLARSGCAFMASSDRTGKFLM